ncbi:MAG: GatB/YqeY domain-containing protein [Candidatus Shapirobacteria bacterium]|jgi:hypothetical protein
MLKDKIKIEVIRALKAGEANRVEALRYLVALIDKKELQLPPGKMGEIEEIGVLQKELRDKKESREMFLKAGRNDLVEKLDGEIAIVSEYLPKALSEVELEEIIDEVIGDKGKDFGVVMREVLVKVAGRAEGGVVAGKVRTKIGG